MKNLSEETERLIRALQDFNAVITPGQVLASNKINHAVVNLVGALADFRREMRRYDVSLQPDTKTQSDEMIEQIACGNCEGVFRILSAGKHKDRIWNTKFYYCKNCNYILKITTRRRF